MVDIIFKACEKLNLTQNTLQLAIIYLDYLVCVVFIPSSQHALYAITGILLAGLRKRRKKEGGGKKDEGRAIREVGGGSRKKKETFLNLLLSEGY